MKKPYNEVSHVKEKLILQLYVSGMSSKSMQAIKNIKLLCGELLESDFSYNFLYTSVSYNSNTYFSGRDSGTDQFNIIPQVSYYHSSGFNASISGIYYQNFDPSWDFTSVSLGYFNTLGKQKNIIYNLGYTHFFYADGYDFFTNSSITAFKNRVYVSIASVSLISSQCNKLIEPKQHTNELNESVGN